MSEQTIISIVTGLVSTIAVLCLVIKMMLDKKPKNDNKIGNPVNLQDFIINSTREHQEQIGLLGNIKESLNRIEEKIK